MSAAALSPSEPVSLSSPSSTGSLLASWERGRGREGGEGEEREGHTHPLTCVVTSGIGVDEFIPVPILNAYLSAANWAL